MSNNGPERDRSVIAELIEHAAQDAIDDRASLAVRADRLDRELADRFNTGVAARGTRAMVFAVFDHLVSLRLIDRAIVLRRLEASLLPPDGWENPYLSEAYSLTRYRGTRYGRFLDAGAHWLLGARDAVFSDLQRDPLPPGPMLYDQLVLRHQRWGKGAASVQEARVAGGVEDLLGTLQLLILRERACGHSPDRDELYRIVVADLEVLSWGSSMRRATARRVLPRPPQFSSELVPDVVWPEQSTADDLFAGHDGVFEETEHPHARWCHQALRSGPKPGDGFCTGWKRYRAATIDARQRFRNFFAMHAARAGVPAVSPTDDAFSSTSVLLLLGADIARETLWTP